MRKNGDVYMYCGERQAGGRPKGRKKMVVCLCVWINKEGEEKPSLFKLVLWCEKEGGKEEE